MLTTKAISHPPECQVQKFGVQSGSFVGAITQEEQQLL